MRTLKDNDVSIAIGSDQYDKTSVPEAEYLLSLGIFDSLELLKIWCETSAEAIFPDRKIGHLKEGYEASFLALSTNPLAGFPNQEAIVLRVKQGEILVLQK